MKVFLPITIILIIAVAIFTTHGFGKQENKIDTKGIATINNPVVSPSGKYQLKIIEETKEGVRYNKFAILKTMDGNSNFKEIYISNRLFRTRDNLYFVWDDNDRVWVYSGDIGTFFWERRSNDNWQQYAYAENKNVNVPEILKKIKPGYFENN